MKAMLTKPMPLFEACVEDYTTVNPSLHNPSHFRIIHTNKDVLNSSNSFTLYSPCILLLIKSFIRPTYELYFLYHVFRPYICFGLLKAILRRSKYFNIDYTSALKSWYIHLRVKQIKTLVPNGFNYKLVRNLLHKKLQLHSSC
jgi:hypothetical protein